MKKIVFIPIIVASLNIAEAQNVNYNAGLKLYNLSSYEKVSTPYRSIKVGFSSYETISSQMLHVTPAFQWKTKNNNFREIELTALNFNKEETTTKITDTTTQLIGFTNGGNIIKALISLRYEYILVFNKTKDNRFSPSIGFAINPYYRSFNYRPIISTSFPTSEYYAGFRTFIIPRLVYFFNERIFLDLNIPLCFTDTYYEIIGEDNPAFPENQRKVTTINFNQFPRIYSGRFGVGIKI